MFNGEVINVTEGRAVEHTAERGEGKSPTGMPPKTPWGKPAMGLRTRQKKKASGKMIVRRRYGRG